MKLYGIEKYSLVDYDGYIACTVFTAGCNMRCPFCHNAALVVDVAHCQAIDMQELWQYLDQRRGLVDAVCITGGEPTLHRDLPLLIAAIRDKGYKVKLDTNGTNPTMLSGLLAAGMLDYVAMDIKSDIQGYPTACGCAMDMSAIEASIRLLMQGTTPYEFRTTVVEGLHTVDTIRNIARWIQGAGQYYLQTFADKGGNMTAGLKAVSPDTMQAMADAATPYIGRVGIRG